MLDSVEERGSFRSWELKVTRRVPKGSRETYEGGVEWQFQGLDSNVLTVK